MTAPLACLRESTNTNMSLSAKRGVIVDTKSCKGELAPSSSPERVRGGAPYLVRALRDLPVQFLYRRVPVNSFLELHIISVTSLILQNKPGRVRRAERSHECLPSGTPHFFSRSKAFCLTHFS